MTETPNRICGWCKKPLGHKENLDGHTHTICEDCAKFMNDSLDAEDAAKAKPVIETKPRTASFNLSKTAIGQSNHQLITNIVVNILQNVSGRGGDTDQAQTNIKELRTRGIKEIGKQIMTRMDDSIHDPHTIWGKMRLIEKVDLRANFRSRLIEIMNRVLASEGNEGKTS